MEAKHRLKQNLFDTRGDPSSSEWAPDVKIMGPIGTPQLRVAWPMS